MKNVQELVDIFQGRTATVRHQGKDSAEVTGRVSIVADELMADVWVHAPTLGRLDREQTALRVPLFDVVVIDVNRFDAAHRGVIYSFQF